jgi:hypothetical protein
MTIILAETGLDIYIHIFIHLYLYLFIETQGSLENNFIQHSNHQHNVM